MRSRYSSSPYSPIDDSAADGRRPKSLNIPDFGKQAQGAGAEFKPSAEDKAAEQDAGMWDFIGDIAPAAGGVIGGIGGGIAGGIGGAATGALAGGVGAIPGAIGGVLGGASTGASLGAGLGGLAGKAAASHADSVRKPAEDRALQTDKRREEQDKRRAELMNMLMSMS